MIHRHLVFLLIPILLLLPGVLSAQNTTPAPANGIDFPTGYRNWSLLAVSHRRDKGSLRAILVNPVARRHADANRPLEAWPQGSIIAKLVWKDRVLSAWPDAIVPGELSHIEIMIKDRKRFSATAGWGFARWTGMESSPFHSDGNDCLACHTRVKNRDFVFTRPAPLP